MFGMIARDRERVHPLGAPLAQRVAAVLEGLQAAHRGRDRGADPVALLLDLEPGVLLRLPRRHDDHLREAIHPPYLFELDPERRLEVLRLARERNRVAGGSNAAIGPAAGLPARRFSQLERTSLPNGVTAPSPVTTTLRRPLAPTTPHPLPYTVDE